MTEIKSEAKLTLWEATSIIIGHSIGGGIMATPYLASRNSIGSVLLIIAVAFLFNILVHFVIAELSYNTGGAQLVKCFETHLYKGKAKKWLTLISFVIYGSAVVVNISGYIVGSADVLVDWFAWPAWLAQLVFYAFAGSVVFFGLKAVGISEKYTIALIFGIISAFVVSTFFAKELNPLPRQGGGVNNLLALFSMVTFALAANQSVVQAVKGLGGNAKKIRTSIVLGIGIDAVIVLAVTLCALLLTPGGEVTKLAFIGLSRGIGSWAVVVGGLFTLLALVTTFWSSTLNLRDIISEQTGLNLKLCWLLATLPSLLIGLSGLGDFLSLTRIVS
ncbi:MAG TPA: aromatic amino acid transport family protein, partial [Clostridiales bacterium]|nr:aromatic amino acid transport family protein [Clostridiales bacterium]